MAKTKKNFGTENRRRPIRRVIGYVRISKNRDNQTSVSTEDTIGTQNVGIETYAGNHKYELVEILGDIGISAYGQKSDRPDFERAIEMIERGQADAIIVFKLDRFCRSVVDFHNAWKRIKAAGGSFISITEGFDSSNPWGEAMMGIIAIFAELESTMKRERAIPAVAFQKENGLVGPGPRPYGYDKTTSKQTKNNRGNSGKGAILKVNPREAALLRTAADWVLQGGSLTGFINHYQPDSAVAHKKMTYRGLKCALTGATTAGLREWADAPDGSGFQPGTWEPIIPRDQWERLREILLAEDRRTSFNNEKRYMLSGMMHCAKCNKKVFARSWIDRKTGCNVPRYMCPDCQTSVKMADIDAIILRELFERVPQSKWAQWQIAGKGWDSTVIDQIESNLAFFDKQLTAGKISQARWLDATGELNEQLAAAQNKEPMDIPHVENLADSWETLSVHDKQRVLRLAFEEIQILPQNGSRDPHTRIAFI